jgi:radical SAM protein with 4Fe4S-binding SPASM domain
MEYIRKDTEGERELDYKPVTGVWEITMGCNMRCKHCGSACRDPLPDELTTDEALRLCDAIGDLGLSWITLSGGEPLIRKDWALLAERLSSNHVTPNIITNGWILDEATLDQALDSGVGTFAISLDGLKETHDFIRREGSYERIINALELMKGKGMTSGVITTLNQRNLGELERLYEVLMEKGVKVWQLQIGLPMGAFADKGNLLLQPEQVDAAIDFIYEHIGDNHISIYPADCLGYYNVKEVAARTKVHGSQDLVLWKGCNAGKRSLGILHNGDILGCTSIRDQQYIEGNIRNTPLREIWESETSFKWSRKLKKSDLGGLCGKCVYGETCLGGCPNTRLTMNGDLYSENNYCSYNVAMKKSIRKMREIDDPGELARLGVKFAGEGYFQLAHIVLGRAIELETDNAEILDNYGYVCYMLGNYHDSLIANEAALRINADSVYANKGMGLCLCKLSKREEGIEYLRKAARMTTASYMEPYHDLIVTLIENGNITEASCVFAEAESKCSGFTARNQRLHDLLC